MENFSEYDAIEEGFEALRQTCDPRGWDLLDALKAVMLAESVQRHVAIKTLDEHFPGFSVKV